MLFPFLVAITDSSKAGVAFTPADKVGFLDDHVTLTCTRNTGDGVVIFDTHDEAGDQLDLLYDSTDPDPEPVPGYAMEVNGDNFILTITINAETSKLTRCNITDTDTEDVTATAMIYMIG